MTTAPPTQLTLDARSEIATMPEKFKPLAVEISDRLERHLDDTNWRGPGSCGYTRP